MSDILTEVDDDGIATITLNRPEKRNAVKFEMWKRLGELFHGYADNPEVRAIILTGAGGCFSAGADISEFSSVRTQGETGDAYDEVGEVCTRAILNAPKPTIAAIEGFCVGGGLGLAVCCDFRFAHDNARLGIPAARLGIVYGWLDSRVLLDIVGLPNAKRILFTAERMDAASALGMGLVDETTQGDVLLEAKRFARTMVSNAPLSIAGAKRILQGLANSEPEIEQISAELGRTAKASADYREGVAAFTEKRPPRFSGC